MIVTTSLLILAGVCVYAATIHLSAGWRRPRAYFHIVFAGLCLLAASFTAFHSLALNAGDAGEFVWALKWNIASVLAFLLLFPWFIALYTGLRPIPLLVGLSALSVVLFVANLMQPYTVQYDRFDGIRVFQLPWGETVMRGAGHNGAWAYLATATVLAVFGYTVYAVGSHFRRERRKTDLWILLGVGVLLMGAIESALARMSVIHTIEFGPFSFLAMVIIISVACARDTQLRLLHSERRFRSLVEQSPFSVQIMSTDGRTRMVNPAWERLWGMKAEHMPPYNILQDRQLAEKGVMPYIEKGFAGEAVEIPPIVYNPAENAVVPGPVRDRWVHAHLYPIKDGAGAITDMVLIYEDITDRKRVEDAIRLIAAGVSVDTGERFFQHLVQSLAKLFGAEYAFIGIFDERDPQRLNTLAVSTHGEIAPDLSYSLRGTPCANVLGRGTCAYPSGVRRQFPDDALLAEWGVDGYIGTPLFDAQGEVLGIMVVLDRKPLTHVKQVTEIIEIFAARAGAELQRLRAEKHIMRMAYYDYLTGLPSRAHLHERLSETLREMRIANQIGALLLIDLDHFKTINDGLSHDVGDEVLRAVGHRLNEVVAERAFVARMGGDEFALLLHAGATSSQAAEKAAYELARQLQEKLLTRLFVGDRAFSLGASIGIVLFPENGTTELDVVRHADMALYRAKHRGRGNIDFYTPELQDAAASRLQLEEGLRHAVANGEMEPRFQPLVDVAGRPIAAEVLLRWHHPERGDIPPDTFIPIAEEAGVIHSIGRWLFDQACERLTSWRRIDAPFTGYLSINVCPWQFARPDFLDEVRHALTRYRINPGSLMLELTESALLYDLEEAIDKITALRALGVRVALDDFGTGYSSLAYLRDLPLDLLKIDKTFVRELSDADENPLIGSMIAIGQHMKLDVVAEGIETETQREILVKLGCERFQGFLFCRPLPEGDFLDWLSGNRAAMQA